MLRSSVRSPALPLARPSGPAEQLAGLAKPPAYYAGRARERVVREDETFAHRFEQSHEHAQDSVAKRQRYAQLVAEIHWSPTKSKGGGSSSKGGGSGEEDSPGGGAAVARGGANAGDGGGAAGALLRAGIDWQALHALEAEVTLRAAAVAELEAEALAANRYEGAELLDRTDKQTALSQAYADSIRAKLALHAAIPDLAALTATDAGAGS